MSNSGPRDPKEPERHQKITIGRVPRSHQRAERTHGTGSLSQRARDMPAPEDSNPLSLSANNPSGFGLPALAYRAHVQPTKPVPCVHNCPLMCPNVFVLAGCRFTYTCVYGQPASTKGGNRYARPFGWPRVKILFLRGKGCAHSAHSYSVSKISGSGV